MSKTAERYDLSEIDFWKKPPAERLEHFREMRENAPISWHGSPQPGSGRGFWAVVRYDDVRRVSRDPETFSSADGISIDFAAQEVTDENLGGVSFLGLDDPEHGRVRGIVQKAFFAPRQIKQIEDRIKADARQIVSELEENESGDFVQRVSKRLPLITISRMLGVPEKDQDEIVGHVETLGAAMDPEFLQGRDRMDVIKEAAMGLGMYAFEMAAHRRENPGDDLITAVVEAEVDGKQLTDVEVAQFMLLLAFAGNDTTRQTTSHSMKALTEFPDQRSLLLEDPEERMPGAVEEFVRWATPVMDFARTATVDTEIAGQRVAAGEKVAMVYPSANRDESAFEDPDRFDITREPNRHVGFGGGGPHFCMGAPLARTQLRAIFAELLRQFPDLEVGEPHYIVDNFINGIASLPMDTGRRAA